MINGLVMARVGFIVLRHCVWRESRDWGLFCCVWLRFVSCYYECNTSCVYLNVEPGASLSSSTWRMEHSLIETLDHWTHAPSKPGAGPSGPCKSIRRSTSTGLLRGNTVPLRESWRRQVHRLLQKHVTHLEYLQLRRWRG